jgi:DNA-binding CsgD family transcriptional regulator
VQTPSVSKQSNDSLETAGPAWGGLFWALPLFYVFVDPYRRQADWLEWLITGLAFAAFLALYTLGLIFWRRKDVLRRQCAAATVVAVAFSAYAPSGAIFFPVIAAFVPFSVNGRIAASAALAGFVILVFCVEWVLLNRATTFARAGYLRKALEAGASAYVLKSRPARDLADVVRRVHRGARVIDPELAAEAIGEVDPLTDRERQVLRLTARGLSTGDIAVELRLSPGTVRNYLSESIDKLSASNRFDAARIAREKGWL